jgi:arylsulfatase
VAFFADFEDFPHQDGSAPNASGINYNFLRAAKAMKTLKSITDERIATPG